jgi:hypothetical protein
LANRNLGKQEPWQTALESGQQIENPGDSRLDNPGDSHLDVASETDAVNAQLLNWQSI